MADATASGHSFLCSETPSAQQLEELLQELGNVGEAFRLSAKVLAKSAVDGSIYPLVHGLVGAPWWQTAAGFEGPLAQEAEGITRTVLELLETLLPLPHGFDVQQLAMLVGRVRMCLGCFFFSFSLLGQRHAPFYTHYHTFFLKIHALMFLNVFETPPIFRLFVNIQKAMFQSPGFRGLRQGTPWRWR